MDISKNIDKSQANILVVEDGAIPAMTLKRILQNQGYNVIVADNGSKGFDIAQKLKPALIISDVVMPVMDGYALCNKIKNDNSLKGIKVILLTQLYNTKDVIKGLYAGADCYVTKPYEDKYLLTKVENLITNCSQNESKETEDGLEVSFENESFVINSERHQILNLLISTYDNSVQQNSKLIETQRRLKTVNKQLELNFDELKITEEENFKTLVELIPDIIYRIDKEGNIIYVNNAIKKLGYKPEELIGKHFSVLILPVEVESVSYNSAVPRYKNKKHKSPKLFDERRSLQRMTKNLQVKLVSKSSKNIKPGLIETIGNDVVTVEINSSGMYRTNKSDSRGQVYIGTVGVVRDITERKRAADALMLSEKMAAIGMLAAGTAHELNNPLMGVLNYIQYLKGEIDSSDPKHDILKKAEKGVNQCTKIVNDLLMFSKKRGNICSKENLNVIILETLDIIDYSIKSNNVEVVKLLDPDLPEVWLAVNQIQQVIINLVTNAIDAMENYDVKELVIKTSFTKDMLEFIIKDTGCGISEENISEIFDPFFTTKSINRGTGLGLSVTKRIVDSHDGTISVKSEIDKGMVFIINIPLNRELMLIGNERGAIPNY